MSTLKILSDTSCTVKCDFQEVGNIQVGELFKLHLKKGCYILEFLVEDIVIFSMDYTIETNDEEPLLRLSIKEQAEKKIMERQFAFVYSKDGRTIIGCNKSFEGELIVPEGVEYIAELAFDSCKATSIRIPNSVTNIGIGAFRECNALSSPVYNDTLFAHMPTSYSGTYHIPVGIKEICGGAFGGCSNLTSITIPDSVTSIGDDAFSGCSSLTSITIPNSVTNLGFHAFSGCSRLTYPVYSSTLFAYMPTSYSGSYNIPEGIKEICGGAFWGCHGLTSITIPNSVTSIGDCAFYECFRLVSVTIPNSVACIGIRAFFDCSGLTSPVYNSTLFVYMPTSYGGSYNIPDGIKEICGGAFWGCRGLTSITIPNSVTSIGDECFCECSRLASITIPNSVTSIGNQVFSGCDGLAAIRIPNSVISIGEWAFGDCCSITSVTIPDSVKDIGNYAFANCNCLTSVNIGNSLMSIGEGVFHGCNINSVMIPISVTSIGDYAFDHCSLVAITIPNNVKSIGKWAFSSCYELTSVTIGYSVMRIGEWAFYECKGLISVIISESVTSIGYNAFYMCKSLTSVHISNLESWCKIGFAGNTSNPLYYARHIFLNGTEIKDLVIPNSVTSIGDWAFFGCDGIVSITIGNCVTSIGEGAFDACANLKEIIIPKGTRDKFERMLPDQKDKLVEQEQIAKKETKDRLLFFDTETTGIPLNYKAPSSDTQNWPRLVQLAWILTDELGNRIHVGNLIVKPDGFFIPADATKVHGITTQMAKEEGIPLAEAIEQFKVDLDMATSIVGHNIEFDKKIVGAEMIRLGLKDELEKKKSYCTMQSSIDFCKIPGKYGFKYPKLQELHRKLFNEDFDDAHNAMSDIEATEKCFWELRKRKLI